MPAVNGPLMRVSAARGGTAEAITKLADGEVTHRWPQILPGARAIVYTAHSAPNSLDTANIVVQPLPTGIPKIVHRGGYHARVLPSGHLVFIQDGALFAAPFDADRLEVTGRPVRIVEGIAANRVQAAPSTRSRRQEGPEGSCTFLEKRPASHNPSRG